jgi:hypothetical protein
MRSENSDNLKDRINRFFDDFRDISDKYEKGYVVAFSFSKGAYEEAARIKKEGLEVRLVEVDELLHGKIKV